MASLEKSADALLQQKAVQSINHEHLERQVLDLERARRSSLVSLRGLMASVQRRSSDLADIGAANKLLDEQLAQDKLKLSALTMAITEDRKQHAQTEAQLSAMADAWMGQPTRIVQVVRALQERSTAVKAAAVMVATLKTAHDVANCVGQATRVRGWANGRLVLQRAHQQICQEGVAKRTTATHAQISLARMHITETQAKRASVHKSVTEAEAQLLFLQAKRVICDEYASSLSQENTRCRAIVEAVANDAHCLSQRFERCQEEQRQTAAELHDALRLNDETNARQHAHVAAFEAARDTLLAQVRSRQDALSQAEKQRLVAKEGLAKLRDTFREKMQRAQGGAFLLCLAQQVQNHIKKMEVARAASKAEMDATLTQLREKHAAHLSHRRAMRLQQRLQEAVVGLEAEESLTRRLEIVAKEADDFQLLQERFRLLRADVETRCGTTKTASEADFPGRRSGTAGAEAERRVQRTAVKRGRKAPGERPDEELTGKRGGDATPTGTAATLAEELGLGAATGRPPASRRRAPAPVRVAAATRRANPAGTGARCRVASLFPALNKEAAPMRAPAAPHRNREESTPKKVRVEGQRHRPRVLQSATETSNLSSPSPRRPAALASRVVSDAPRLHFARPASTRVSGGTASSAIGSTLTSAIHNTQSQHALPIHSGRARPMVAGDRRPLRHDPTATSFAGFGVFSQPVLGHQQPSQLRGKTTLKPIAVRPTERADLFADNGEDLFADVFS